MEKLRKAQQLVRAAKALLIESENAQRFDALQCTYILDPAIAILDTVLEELGEVVEPEQIVGYSTPDHLAPANEGEPETVWQAATQVQMYPFSCYPPSQRSMGT
ncbi:MAG: hypothetical protein ACPGVO_16370 [Spirulinaceae cyanobacterium]